VLTTDIREIAPVVSRMRRLDDPARLAALLERLNGE
jgi:hypothetical protein